MLPGLDTFATLKGLGNTAIKDKYTASRITLCSKKDGEEYQKKCLDRQCTECGTFLVDDHFQPLLSQHTDSQIKWNRWELKAVTCNGQNLTRMTKIQKAGTIRNIIDELKTELVQFSKHLFDASWQWRQYENLCNKLPDKWVVFCMDYAENYTCRSQDEAQAAHWANVQCTIHPVVATYHCPEEGCHDIVTDSIVFISNDQKHCCHGVQHFNSLAINHLLERGVEIQKLIHFTDCAPTQYKNKTAFVDASFSLQDFGFPTEKHFFGSRHGKGPCDREIGVIKKQVRLAVVGRQAEITNAEELYDYAKQNLLRPKTSSTSEHVHSRRSFIYVPFWEIKRRRSARMQVKALSNTRLQHAIRGIEPFVVAARERSCFCVACLRGEICPNVALLGSWRCSNLKTGKPYEDDLHVPQASVNQMLVDDMAHTFILDNDDLSLCGLLPDEFDIFTCTCKYSCTKFVNSIHKILTTN